MFNFLKEKLKKAVENFQDKVEEEVPEQESQEAIEVKPEIKEELKEQKEPQKEEAPKVEETHEKGFFTKLKEKITKKQEVTEEVKEPVKEVEKEIVKPEPVEVKEVQDIKDVSPAVEEVVEEPTKELVESEQPKIEEPVQEEVQEKKGFFQFVKEKVTTKKIGEDKFEELFWDIELALLENNVAVEVIEKIKKDLKTVLVDKPIKKSDYDDIILLSLKQSIKEVLSIKPINILQKIKEKKERPFVIAFIGVNGVGKTTSIAKVAHYLKKNNLNVIIAAGDTWRAGSVEQLETWATRLNVPLVKAQYGADPASIAYDAIAMAKSKHLDVVLIDTAGRQHKNINLMRELQKILNVSKADLTLLTVESIVGNDAVEQAANFGTTINLDGSILTKSDIDEKGGAILSIAYITKKPIVFLGTGQELDHLEIFDSEKILARLGL